MAVLKLYNEIVDEEDKLFMEWMGQQGVCFRDVTDFINDIAETDTKIDIRIHCPGGNCVEGWAMYDALRTSGKEISVTIEGECSSMATIILLAAPKERRFGTQNARILVHNPSIAYLDLWTDERLTADTIEDLKAKLDAQERMLVDEQERIMALYLERTDAKRDDLEPLMKEERFMDMTEALSLGFIGSILAPNTDQTRKTKNMKETKVKTSLLNRALAKLGIAKLEDLAPETQVFTAPNGDELVVERAEGNPQAGDAATVNGEANGEVVLEDGKKVVVSDGQVTDIVEPEPPTTEDEYKAKITALESQVTTLTEEKATLQADFDEFKATAESEKTALQADFDNFKATAEAEKTTLQEEFDAFKATAEAEKTELQAKIDSNTATAKTEDEVAILDLVEKAGGKAWLDKVKSLSSTFRMASAGFQPHAKGKQDPEAKIGAGFLEDYKNKK